jgi:hypothetical protein
MHAEATAVRGRSFAPKEHGAYGQLAFPLVTALATARPTVASLLLISAAVVAFVLHEPALIVLGHRGSRARREDGPRALRWLVVLGGTGALAGALGTWLAPTPARLSIGVALALATAVGALVATRLERTAVGEVVAAAALCGAAVPVALASSVPVPVAVAAFVAWCSAFTAGTLGVRAVIAHAKTPRSLPARIAGTGLVVVVTVALAAMTGRSLYLAGLPLALAALAVAAAAPSPRSLKKVGWTLVGASAASAVAAIALSRA